MKADPAFLERAVAARRRLAEMHGWPESGVFASHRHALVMDLYEMVAVHRSRGRRSLLERLDDLLINPFGGFLSVAAAFAVTMLLAFKTGDLLSDLISTPLETVETSIRQSGSGLWAAVLCGLFDGFVAGAGIVLPYLIPLLILMAVFEDTGFLPRIAFMVDGMLHRFGLHGKSAIPLMMGLGCTVPAVMSARNMENSRDRLLVMLVVPFIPCSARSMVILALAGKYLGAWAVILIYAAGVAMALMVSLLISKLSRRAEAGFIMDVPPLRRPYPSVLVKKVWFRLREFLVFAWPVILASSILLSLMNHAGVEAAVNRVLAPLTTTVLRLPEQTGITLFLGFFRKELTLAMLGTALGTMDVSSVLSGAQILVLVIFVTLYIPCLATVSVIWKEGGAKAAALSVLLGLAAATLAAGCLARAIV
jgi:ferrous iron transport protein B